MDYETIQNKSMADLKEIAGMLGIKVPRSCTKAKLIAMITGEETEEAPPAQEEAKNVSGLAGATEEKAQKETAEKPAAEKAPEKQPANDQPSQPAKAQPEQPANAAEEGGRKKGRPKKSAKPVNAVPAETPAEKNAATPAPDASKEEEKPAASETPKNGEKTGKKKAGRPKKEAKAEKATGPAATAGAEPETAGAAAPDTGTPAQEEKPVAPSENSAEKNPEAPQTAEGGKKREFQENTSEVTGLLDIMTDGYGFLRTGRYFTGSKDVFVPPNFIRKYALRTGDEITGRSRPQRDNDKYPALFYITEINGFPPEAAFSRGSTW